ncbi:MAG: two-component regulator propeller domain-containing protein [Gammaproteobacteria bacterium]
MIPAFPVLLLGLTTLLSIVACSDNETDSAKQAVISAPKDKKMMSPPRLPRILETFDVGEEVYVRSLAIDEYSGSLWVGTSVGVHEIDLESYEPRNTFTRDAGLANEYVFSIFIDNENEKWFGTNGGGVSRFNEGTWKTYFPMHGLADYWVYSFAEQSDGTLWIGTWDGANALDKSKGEFSTYVDELVNEWVYGIGVDSHDQVWFGTEGGVSMFDGVKWRAWTHENGLGAPNDDRLSISQNTGLGTRNRHDLSLMVDGKPSYNQNYVLSLLAAQDDTIWAGTWGGGVSWFDGAQWTNLTEKDGLAGNIVLSIAQGNDGVFWFGTNQGISRYDGKTWHNIDINEGTSNSAVYSIAVSANGDVWAGAKGAVIKVGF